MQHHRVQQIERPPYQMLRRNSNSPLYRSKAILLAIILPVRIYTRVNCIENCWGSMQCPTGGPPLKKQTPDHIHEYLHYAWYSRHFASPNGGLLFFYRERERVLGNGGEWFKCRHGINQSGRRGNFCFGLRIHNDMLLEITFIAK